MNNFFLQSQRKLSVASPQPPKLMLSEEIDDAGIERRLKLLQKEEKKVHPNKPCCFRTHEKDIPITMLKYSLGTTPIPTFLETYPSLRHCDQVSIICTVI